MQPKADDNQVREACRFPGAPSPSTAVALAALVSGLYLLPGAAFQSTVTLVRGPYLQQVGAASGIVVWATREPGPATVQYRTGTAAFSTATATSVFRSSSSTGIASYYQHEAVLTGLRASTTYEYDLRVAGVDCTPGVLDAFRTAPAPGTGTIRLVAFGDSGTGSTAQGQIASLMRADTFDLALHTGDIAYSSGTYAQFDSYFFAYYRDWLRRTAIFPSIGNHDDRTVSATPYRRFFVLPAHGGSAAYPNNAERFYSFDYGPVHFIALDTEAAFLTAARREEQLAWLIDDLQNSQHQPWRVAFFHRPPYSSGGHGSELSVRQAFGPIFEQYNVQVALAGHDHSFERSVPWRVSTSTDRQAVTYVVTGGGGAGLYPVRTSEWTAYSRAAHHYVRAEVSPAEFHLEAVGTDGVVLHSFTLDRDLQERDASPPTVSIQSPASGAVLNGEEQVVISAADDSRVEKVDLWVDGQFRDADIISPYSFTLDTTSLANGSHTLRAVAHDIDGKRTSSSRTVTVANGTSAGDIVLHATDAAPTGSWRVVNDATAAGDRRLEDPQQSPARTVDPPLAEPLDYFELTVNVMPDTDYRLWLRMRAAGNSGYNDSVWVQTTDTVDPAGASVFRIGTPSATRINLQDCQGCSNSGWGWQDNGYGTGVLGPVLRFQNGGLQTIRIQAREDGVSVDQIVLSPSTYLNSAPGAARNDTTELPRTQ